MEMTTIEILDRGMQILVDNMGIIEAEQFVSAMIREKFDYTKWQRNYFDNIPTQQLHKDAVRFAKENPFSGKAKIIRETE